MATRTQSRVPVGERALIARINRRLKEQDRQLRRARGFYDDRGSWHEDTNLGRFYIIDLRRNFAVDKCVDLEECGRSCGALAAWECFANEQTSNAIPSGPSMTPEQDDEMLLNVPSNAFENQITYVAMHDADDLPGSGRLFAVIFITCVVVTAVAMRLFGA